MTMNTPTEKTDWWNSLRNRIADKASNVAIILALMLALGYGADAYKKQHAGQTASRTEKHDSQLSIQEKINQGLIEPATMSTLQQDSLRVELEIEANRASADRVLWAWM